MNFNASGLKKLTAACCNGSPIENEKKSYCKNYNGDTAKDLDDIKYGLIHNPGGGVRELKGNGDFRRDECIKLLHDSDIAVTNLPFSLFREYIAQLVKYGKKFIIIANVNAIIYKKVFPLLCKIKCVLKSVSNILLSIIKFFASWFYAISECENL